MQDQSKHLVPLSIVFAALMGPPSLAATLHVPADHPTIQSCIDAAVSGQDECVVAPGTYNERITLFFKSIVLRSSHGPALTTIDGTGLEGSVVTVFGGNHNMIIEGFKITGGRTSGSGGGIYAVGEQILINNVITNNHAMDEGGGIYVQDGVVANCVISGNRATDGAGLTIGGGFSTRVLNCTITGNSRIAPRLHSAGYGIGGQGIHVAGDGDHFIANTIVAFNESPNISWNHSDYFGTSTSPPQNNCFHGSLELRFNGVPYDPIGTNGNVGDDPQLVGVHFPLTRIQANSPCVDAGNSSLAMGNSDIDGQARIQGRSIDIGADESDGTSWPTGPLIIVHVTPDGDDSADGLTWATAKRTIQAASDLASERSGDVWIKSGDYLEHSIHLLPCVRLYGGFKGGETQLEQRDWLSNPTTINGQSHNWIFWIGSGEERTRVDGLIIKEGRDNYNAGAVMYVEGTSPVIINNAFQSNYGSAMYLDRTKAIVKNNTFAKNGRGLYTSVGAKPIVEQNLFDDNGTAIHAEYGAMPIVKNNIIRRNSSAACNAGNC